LWNTARIANGTLPGWEKSTTPGARSRAAANRHGGILIAMSVGNVARVTAVLAALVAAAGSASSTSSGSQNQAAGPNGPNGQGSPELAAQGAPGGPDSQNGPPPSQQMDPERALGLWRSTFGAVKIEPDGSHGGLASGSVQGIWMYQRQGQDVIGYFAGSLRGNVLQFRWQEPNDSAPLAGEGFLVFDTQGRQYSGRWWSDRRDRVGDWNGWRQSAGRGTPASNPGPGPDDPQPARRQRQPYQQPPSPYAQPTQQPAQQSQPTYYN
jgi:hypothetical protein